MFLKVGSMMHERIFWEYEVGLKKGRMATLICIFSRVGEGEGDSRKGK